MLAIRLRPGWAAIERLIDYFVHPVYRRDLDKLYRVRILIGLLLLFNLVTVAVIILEFTNDFPPLSRIIALSVSLAMSAGYIFLLFRLRRDQRSYYFCSGMAILLIDAAVSAGTAFSGGSMETATGQLLAVPMVMAYFFGGSQRGNQAVMLTYLILTIFAVLGFSGVHFPRPAGSVELQRTAELLVGFIGIVMIAAMAHQYETTAAKLEEERDHEHRKAIALAQTDALTGLANRRNFDTLLEQRITVYAAAEPVRRFALCYIDLDGFKPINDAHGHNVGDEVLQIVATRLQQVVRGSDSVCRQGGDEFTLLIDSSAERADLEALARRTLNFLCEALPTSVGLLNLGASIGLAVFPEDGASAEQIKRAADSAMYEAKRGGGNRWCFSQGQPVMAAAESEAGAARGGGESAIPPLEDAGPQVAPAMSQPDAARPAELVESGGFIARLVESYIHPSLRDGSVNLRRVRIFIMTLMMIFAMIVANIILMAAIPAPYISTESNTFSLLICLPIMLILYGLLAKLRSEGVYLTCCKVFVLLEFAAILVGTVISGGAAASPAAQFFAFPPLMAFFFGGVRWGRTSVLIAVVIYAILWVLDLSDFSFPQTLNTSTIGPMRVIDTALYIAVIAGMAWIYESISASLKQERDLEYENVNRLAQSDALTGLANRHNFDAELAARITRYSVRVPRSRFALCYLDLDGFKPINDRYGHDVGDEVLRVVSERLRACLRDADYVGRHGGDEFMLIFDAVSDEAQVAILARRLLAELELPMQTRAGVLLVSGSLGFAVYPVHATEAVQLRSAADKAMYAAKEGRTGWSFYRPEQYEAGMIQPVESGFGGTVVT